MPFNHPARKPLLHMFRVRKEPEKKGHVLGAIPNLFNAGTACAFNCPANSSRVAS